MCQAVSRTVVSMALFVASVIASGASWAGIGEADGEIGFDIGITQLDEHFQCERIALRGGYFINDLLEIELDVSKTSKDGSTEFDQRAIVASAVFNFSSRNRIVPYLRAGIGLADLEVSHSTYYGSYSDNETGAAVQLGAGSRFFVGGRTAIRVELSWMHQNASDNKADQFSGTVGMAWRLGKKR